MLFKRFILAILILQWIFFVGMKSYLVLEWKWNQDLITQKYCENKNNPMLNCNGQCYLAKQLRALEFEEKQERSKFPSPEHKIKQFELDFINQFNFSFVEFIFTDENCKRSKIEMIKSFKSDFIQEIPIPPPQFC
jgi:hypothetical protein